MKKRKICLALALSMVLSNTAFAAPPMNDEPVIRQENIPDGTANGTNISAVKPTGTPYTNEERILSADKVTVSDDTTLANGWEWATPNQELTEDFADTEAVYKENGEEKNRVTVRIKKLAVTDDTAPTGEIKISTNIWNTFLNFITFGLLFDETQSVEITANDDISGVESIEYYVSNTAMTLDDVKGITNWTVYKSAFDLSEDNQYVIYAKITDKAGNVSYISSDGIEIEKVQGSIVGEVRVADGAPNVYAKGLSFIASEEDTKQANDNEVKIQFYLDIDKKEKAEAEGAEAIDEAISGAAVEVDMYLDMKLTKTTTQLKGDNKGSSKEEDISDTNTKVIEVLIPYDDENVTIFRYNRGDVTVFRKLAGENAKGLYTDGDLYTDESGYIHVFMAKFGTLALAKESSEEQHTHSYTSTVTKEPTCEEAGEMTYTCECGESYTEVIPALGHDYEGKVTKEPTSKSEGTVTYTCSRCGDSYTVAMEKLPEEETEETTSRRSSGGGKSSGKAVSSGSSASSGGSAANNNANADSNTDTNTDTSTDSNNGTDEKSTGKTDDKASSGNGSTTETYKGFSDIKGMWCENIINELHKKGIVNGRSAEIFAPNVTIKRAELVQMLANMKGIDLSAYKDKTSRFTDVKKTDWYYAAIVWGEENNIIYGTAPDKYSPEKYITREDTAAIIYRYMDIPADANAKVFSDSANVSGYAKDAVSTLSAKGIIKGYPDNSFKPKNTITRAETASVIYNVTDQE